MRRATSHRKKKECFSVARIVTFCMAQAKAGKWIPFDIFCKMHRTRLLGSLVCFCSIFRWAYDMAWDRVRARKFCKTFGKMESVLICVHCRCTHSWRVAPQSAVETTLRTHTRRAVRIFLLLCSGADVRSIFRRIAKRGKRQIFD